MTLPAILVLLASLSGLVAALPAAQVIQGPEVEQLLKKGKFVAKEPLGSGVTGSLKVTLQQNGVNQLAVLKVVDFKRPGLQPNAKGELELDFQDSWKTEIAAYELDKLLGLGMVPATVQRSSPYDGKEGSVQLWVEAAMSEAKRRERAAIPPDAESWANQFAKMSVFDALIYNTDRHPDNLLITSEFQVRLIDHSRSFRPNAELRNKEDVNRFSRALMARIEQLNSSVLGKKLGDYLTLNQLNGLMKRRQLLLDRARELSRQYGEQAVYYP